MLITKRNTKNKCKTVFKQNSDQIFTLVKENELDNYKNASTNQTQRFFKSQKAFPENNPSQSKPFEATRVAQKKKNTILGQSQSFKENVCVKGDFQLKQHKDEYFSFQNYSFRKLTSQYRTQVLQLLTYSFIEQEPLAKSFYKQFPEQKVQAYKFWEQYWDMYMDDAIESGINLVIVDTDKKDELIGVYTFKNFNYFPPNASLDEKYLGGFNVLSAQVVLQEELIHSSPHQVQEILLNSPLVAQAWAAAIKEQHIGKRLYSKLTALAQKVLKDAGFQYVLVFASNFLSSKVLKKLDFTQVSQLDCEQFELLGNKPFALIQQLHKRPSLWFKDIKDSK